MSAGTMTQLFLILYAGHTEKEQKGGRKECLASTSSDQSQPETQDILKLGIIHAKSGQGYCF